MISGNQLFDYVQRLPCSPHRLQFKYMVGQDSLYAINTGAWLALKEVTFAPCYVTISDHFKRLVLQTFKRFLWTYVDVLIVVRR